MNQQPVPIAPIPPPAEIVHPAQADQGIRYHQAILDVMRRGRAELRRQVEVLRTIVEYAVEGANLVDEMQQNRALPQLGDNQWSLSELRTPSVVPRQRVSEWRSLRDNGALAFIDAALAAERVTMFEKASFNWIRERVERIGREREADEAEEITPAYDYELRHGDLRTALDDLAGQVDVIVTDPPYPAEYLDEYDVLSETAARILKPDGMLVAMVGHAHLPEHIRRLSLHLSYRWCGCYLLGGAGAQIFGDRFIGRVKWKPLLIFDLNGKRRFLPHDVFVSAGREKLPEAQIDGWSQSESGMADIIEHCSQPGDLVVDPFLGAGTTGVACHALGRRFIGCDVSADAVLAARKRLDAVR
jgi:hypothetical protein